MDSNRFDNLTKAVAEAVSRRSMLKGVAAGAAGAVLALVGVLQGDDLTAEARKRRQRQRKRHNERKNKRDKKEKKRDKKRKKRAPECERSANCPQPSNPCKKRSCRGGKCTKENRQDGTDCGGGNTCVNGQCQTPPPRPECLSSGDCGPGRVCCSDNTCCAGFEACASGDATTTFVQGPDVPPRGQGSAQFAVGPDGFDAAQLRSADFAGTLVEQITALQYATFVQTADNCPPAAGGGQAPYLILNLAFSTQVSGRSSDLLFFEPLYNRDAQPNIPAQGPVACDTWQTWDAGIGGWYSVFGVAGTSPGFGTTKTLAEYVAAVGEGNARIVNGTAATCAGGLRIVSGFGGDPWADFVGNANFLEIAIDNQTQEFLF